MALFSLLSLIALFVILCGLFWLVMIWSWSLTVTRAPYVPIPEQKLSDIVDALALGSGAVCYDLGSGDGRVLRAAAQTVPNARYIGIEMALFPYLVSQIWYRMKGGSITVLRRNFFDCDLSDATHVFTYLFPELMDELLPKLEKELMVGTRLISCDFQFRKKEPIEVREIAVKGLGSRLYIYQF